MAILVAAALMILAAFLADSRIVVDRQPPQQFPLWLFWTGVALGTIWFVRAERHAAAGRNAPGPRVSARGRTLLSERHNERAI
jgi:hypothetical protein